MQTWPALRNLLAPITCTARSTSASSKTMTGEWPPSSIVQRFSVSAASFCRCLPTGIEPVKDSFFGIGEASRWRETSSGTPKTTFSTPFGSPASISARAIATAVAGVSSDGLMISEQPAPSAPATLRMTFTAGKFQATKASAGPTGSLTTSCRAPGMRAGIIRP